MTLVNGRSDRLPPADQSVHSVTQPPLLGGRPPATTRSRIASDAAAHPPSPRIAEVLALEERTVAQLAGFLADPDPGVRRTAVATLTEHTPYGYASALLDALADGDAAVRRAAADGARELVEVIPHPEASRTHLGSPDPVIRAAVVYLRATRRVGEAGEYRAALADPDHRVRIEAVRALVSVDDVAGVTAAVGDGNREVRIAVANAVATLRAGVGAVSVLIDDQDPLVRAAGLAALGELAWGEEQFAAAGRALQDSAWQVRVGAARALSEAPAARAVPLLSQSLEDVHLDVRKAAVLGLTRWAASDVAAADALSAALKDSDADVRAYARRALDAPDHADRRSRASRSNSAEVT